VPSGYREIFEERGGSYDDAMDRWPHVRDEELRFAVELAQPVAGERVVDVPAGGGYLRDHLPAGVEHVAVEPSATFVERSRRRGATAVESSLRADVLAASSADVVISLAGVHHEPDVFELLVAWRRVLVAGGRIVLADVATGSAEAAFLDGFVGRHNGHGHRGTYLGPDLADIARRSGLTDVRVTDGSYAWWAEDRAALVAFCTQLFGLRDVAPDEVDAALVDGPGIVAGPDGRVGLRWGLRALVATSP
jgi:SAM-dependent methyltransferase